MYEFCQLYYVTIPLSQEADYLSVVSGHDMLSRSSYSLLPVPAASPQLLHLIDRQLDASAATVGLSFATFLVDRATAPLLCPQSGIRLPKQPVPEDDVQSSLPI